MNHILIGCATTLLGGFTTYMCAQSKSKKNAYCLRFQSDWSKYDDICQYLVDHYGDQIYDFTLGDEAVMKFSEWSHSKRHQSSKLRTFGIQECDLSIPFTYQNKDYKIDVVVRAMLDQNKNRDKLMCDGGCHVSVENFVNELVLTGDDKKVLIEFVDRATEYSKERVKECLESNNQTMSTYYYKNEYWTLLSKVPKRPLHTIYLKKGVKETFLEKANDFFSKDTRDSYVKYGIPYKYVCMIYGPPGTGKTSIIKGIASELDCDLYILPITKTMSDSNFVDAFNYINDTSEKKRVIVIEDIDTLFDDRKEGDKDSRITMQSVLNCLDGFTCVEGTLLYITANKPEVLDDAMIRSCRIDHRVNIDYADKYQTKSMFDVFFPDSEGAFQDFYKTYQHKNYTTAMLQEFLFYNRKCENIIECKDQFQDIIDKNASKNYEVVKEGNKGLYM